MRVPPSLLSLAASARSVGFGAAAAAAAAGTAAACTTAVEDQKVLLACSGCLRVHYCSEACQRADWPAHRARCKRKI